MHDVGTVQKRYDSSYQASIVSSLQNHIHKTSTSSFWPRMGYCCYAALARNFLIVSWILSSQTAINKTKEHLIAMIVVFIPEIEINAWDKVSTKYFWLQKKNVYMNFKSCSSQLFNFFQSLSQVIISPLMWFFLGHCAIVIEDSYIVYFVE